MQFDVPTARSPRETGPSAVVGPGGPLSPGPGTIRVRLDISYQGTDFVGWAEQPGRRSVAGVLGEALGTLLRAPVRLVVAGRTDSGVHATGQVAHVDVDRSALLGLTPRDRRPVGTATSSTDPWTDAAASAAALVGLIRRLAGLLPGDVRVRAASVAPDGFDARFSALRRHYRYRIGTADWGVEPADRPFVLALRRTLDVSAMDEAGQRLLGLRDFAAYCKPREGATTIRELQRLRVRAAPDASSEVWVDVTADAFCHSMVRSLVGALTAVGLGRDDVDAPARRLAGGVRAAFPVAAAHGLTLLAVDYPPTAELAGRATSTRALRADPSPAGAPAAAPGGAGPGLGPRARGWPPSAQGGDQGVGHPR